MTWEDDRPGTAATMSAARESFPTFAIAACYARQVPPGLLTDDHRGLQQFRKTPGALSIELERAGTTARDGSRASVSMSSAFSPCYPDTRAEEPSRFRRSAPRMLSMTFRVLFGREGPPGIRAGSTTRIFEDLKPAVIPLPSISEASRRTTLVGIRLSLQDAVLNQLLGHLVRWVFCSSSAF